MCLCRTMELISRNFDTIMLNVTASIPAGAEYDSNRITGEIHALPGGDQSAIKSTDCKGTKSLNRDHVTTKLLSGFCSLPLYSMELAKILESDSIKVSLQLQLVYASHSQEVGSNARECKGLKLEAFGRSQFETVGEDAAGNTRESQMERAQKHRVSLEWSISEWSERLKLEPDGTDWLQSFQLETQEQPHDWYRLQRVSSCQRSKTLFAHAQLI